MEVGPAAKGELRAHSRRRGVAAPLMYIMTDSIQFSLTKANIYDKLLLRNLLRICYENFAEPAEYTENTS